MFCRALAPHSYQKGEHFPVEPTSTVALVLSLKACSRQKDLCTGIRLHAHILKQGFLIQNIFIGSTLVNLYAKCGALSKARQVFDELPVRNVVSWNALVAGYAQHGHGGTALICFEEMQEHGFSPNEVTFACILKACGSIGAASKGKEIHAEIARLGLLQKNIVLGNALVDLYAKCGALANAQQVFNELISRNVVSWNALIAGYSENGHGDEALNCYECMQGEGLSPNAVTFLCVLKACGSIGAVEKGCEIHFEIVRQKLLRKDPELCNALVDMYAKCGALAKAQKVFDEHPTRDIFAWTALIAGYSEHGHGEKALECFERMKWEGLSPDAVTFLCLLKVCASLGAVDKGEVIHVEIAKAKLLEGSVVLGNAVLDMYVKCGALSKAERVFDKLPFRDVVSWTTLIAGYCQQGRNKEAFRCFEGMRHEGLVPDSVTFTCFLKLCGT